MADGYDFPASPNSPQGYDFAAPAKKPSFLERAWEWGNKPLIDAPAEAGATVGNKMMDWGEQHGGFLGNLARYGGAYTQSLGNVVSQLTSPVNAALTAATMGAGTAEKLGATELASSLRVPGYVAAGAQTAHGAKDIYEGHPVIGGVEAGLGLLGLRGAFKGEPQANVGPNEEVVPTAQTGPGTAVGTGKGRSRVVSPRPIQPSGETVKVQPGAGAADTRVPYREGTTASDVAQAVRDAREAAKAETQAADLKAVENARVGLVPRSQQVSTSATGEIPGEGMGRVTTTWGPPEEDVVPKTGRATPSITQAQQLRGIEVPGITDAPHEQPAVAEPAAPETPVAPPVVREDFEPTPEQHSYAPPMETTNAGIKPAAEQLAQMLGLDINNVPEDNIPTPRTPVTAEAPAQVPATARPGDLFNTHPEVQSEADRLGEAYRGGDKTTGKQLAELRDFMSGNKMRESWRGAPEGRQFIGENPQEVAETIREAKKVGIDPSKYNDLEQLNQDITKHYHTQEDLEHPEIGLAAADIGDKLRGKLNPEAPDYWRSAPQGPAPQGPVEGPKQYDAKGFIEDLKRQLREDPGERDPENYPKWLTEGLVEAPSSPPEPLGPDVPAATTPEAKNSLLDQLKALYENQASGPDNERGGISPELVNFLGRAGLGALGGGVIGGQTGHPILGALGGALGAGLIGPGAARNLPAIAEAGGQLTPKINPAIETLNRAQSAGLFGPLSLAKKILGDTGNLGLALASEPEYRSGLVNAIKSGLPEAWGAAKEAFGEPVREDTTGLPPSGVSKIFNRGPLSWTGRGFNAVTEGFKNLYDQAGMPESMGEHYTMTDLPENKVAKEALLASYKSPIVQNISPALRMMMNRLRGGLNEYTPLGLIGEGNFTPKNMIKAAIGPIAGLAAFAATPDDFARQHPYATATIGAGAGLLGIPVLAGMAAKNMVKDPAASVSKAIVNEIPGARLVEDVAESPKQFLPNYASRYTNALKPLAEFLDPQERQTTGADSHWYDKTIANVPFLRETLPPKDFKWSELTGGNMLSPSGYDFK